MGLPRTLRHSLSGLSLVPICPGCSLQYSWKWVSLPPTGNSDFFESTLWPRSVSELADLTGNTAGQESLTVTPFGATLVLPTMRLAPALPLLTLLVAAAGLSGVLVLPRLLCPTLAPLGCLSGGPAWASADTALTRAVASTSV